jgi:hypothetical protein
MDSPAAQTPPPDLYGRAGADRFMRGLTAFNDFYLRLMDRALWRDSRPAPPVPEVPAWRALVVAERSTVADGAVSIRLVAPDGGPLKPWQPGVHLQILLPSGLVRHYSLCGDPADQYSYTITVRRAEGGRGSAEVHERLKQGSVIRIMFPRNARSRSPPNQPYSSSPAGSESPRSCRWSAKRQTGTWTGNSSTRAAPAPHCRSSKNSADRTRPGSRSSPTTKPAYRTAHTSSAGRRREQQCTAVVRRRCSTESGPP